MFAFHGRDFVLAFCRLYFVHMLTMINDLHSWLEILPPRKRTFAHMHREPRDDLSQFSVECPSLWSAPLRAAVGSRQQPRVNGMFIYWSMFAAFVRLLTLSYFVNNDFGVWKCACVASITQKQIYIPQLFPGRLHLLLYAVGSYYHNGK